MIGLVLKIVQVCSLQMKNHLNRWYLQFCYFLRETSRPCHCLNFLFSIVQGSQGVQRVFEMMNDELKFVMANAGLI